MCQHHILATAIEKIRENFNVQAPNLNDWEPPIVVNPGSQSLIITRQNQTELTLSTFGMTPSWARSPMQLINARTEGDKNPDNKPDFRGSKAIFLKKAFRKPFEPIIIQSYYGHRKSKEDHGHWLGNNPI